MGLPTWLSAPSGAAARPLRLAVGAAVLGATAVGLYALGQHLLLFIHRASFPLDLEWMEGGMLLHARRLLDGQPIYAPPSLDFIPYLYTPLYPALLALLAKLLPLGYLLGRGLSIAAFAGALALLVVVAARQAGPAFARAGWSPGRDRWLALPTAVGVAAAGLVAASFAFTGSFYDLVRADSLLLLLEAAALTAALLGGGTASAAAAGLLIALAFFTKQTASLLGVAIGLGLLVAGWRRGIAYGLAAAVALAAGLLLLDVRSGGWFWRYVFELHQSHGFNTRLAYVETPLKLLRQYHWLYAGLALAVAALALQARLHRRDAIHLAAALAGFAAACIGFGTQWAFDNAYIPAVYFPAYSLSLLGARLVGQALGERPAAALPAGVAAVLIAAALAANTWPAALPDGRFQPVPSDRTTASRFL
jgi:hypothetical protein